VLTQSLDIHYADRTDPTVVTSAYGGAANTTPTPPTENLYLRWVVEGGALGFAALLTMIALLVREGFAASATAEQRHWRYALQGLMVVFIVESAFMDTLMFEQVAVIFWLIVSICMAGVQGGIGARDERVGWRAGRTVMEDLVVLEADSTRSHAPRPVVGPGTHRGQAGRDRQADLVRETF
jgi:hypothetical protein